MPEDDKEDKKKARDVFVTLYKDGRLKHIKDKEGPHLIFERGKYQKAGLPLDGEHFEWMLSEYERTGVPITSLYRAYGHMAPNEQNSKDLNTVKIDLPKLVKLDCGLWAAYKVDREYKGKDGGPQRDFGLIEQGHVWQAQYVSAMHPKKRDIDKINKQTQKELKDAGAVLATMLVKMVEGAKLGAIELLKHAYTEKSPVTGSSLYICFPDIHLPEKWPDLPNPEHRYGGKTPTKKEEEVRSKLQRLLRACQSRPGLLYGSRLGRVYAEKVQKYIEDLSGLEELWVNGNRDDDKLTRRQLEVPIEGKWTIMQKNIFVTAQNFLAEKDIVDRALRVHSSWFYGPGKTYYDQKRHKKAPPFNGKDDLHKILLDCDAGDATPAFDLVNLLIAVMHLRRRLNLDILKQEFEHDPQDWQQPLADLKQQEYGPENVRLRQVGDLFELWQNREFLYHGFWVRQTDAGSEVARKSARAAAVALFSKNHDGYQYRKDELYYDPDAKSKQIPELSEGEHRRKLAKWYTYNPIPKEMLKYRYVVGDMVQKEYLPPSADEYADKYLEDLFRLPPSELKRRRKLLADRIKSAKEFSLPIPKDSALGKCMEQLYSHRRNSYLGRFYRTHFGDQMVGWKLVKSGTGVEKYYLIFAGRLGHCFPVLGPNLKTRYRKEDYLGCQAFLWSRLILDLLAELGCQAVYGNHDSYRGDPLLNSEAVTVDKVRGANAGPLLGWLSEPGLWFEHGHRWDQYNRDGCAFGSGPTNLGYYWWHNLGARTKAGKFAKTEGEKKYGKQEQKCYQAGAALWFLLLRNKENLPWLNQQVHFKDNKVHPFGIYVCGHTHTADLVDISFSLESSAKKEMTQKGFKEKITRKMDLSAMSKERSTAKRYAFDQKAEYERHVAQSGKVNRLPWLKKRPE
jgi:hypothetical protein